MTAQDFHYSTDLPWGLIRTKDDLILFDLQQISPTMLLFAKLTLEKASSEDRLWLVSFFPTLAEDIHSQSTTKQLMHQHGRTI